MLIEVNKLGVIIRGSQALPEGMNVFGSIRGRIDPQTLQVSAWRPLADEIRVASDREAILSHGNASCWRVDAGRLVFAAPDLSGVHDVFYAPTPAGSWLIGRDFLELASANQNLDFNHEAVNYFITHGYFYGAETFFRQINRVPAGKRLVFNEDGPGQENLFTSLLSGVHPRPRTYEGFKKIFESICMTEQPGAHDAILLSGGWDSALLAAQVRRTSSEPVQAVTFKYQPDKDSNREDIIVAARLASFLGINHHVIPVNLADLSASLLDPLVERMPLAAHMAVNILAGTKDLQSRGISRTWCGQNADSIYNLGPTSRLGKGQGKIDLVKRLYLSRPFIQTLSDVQKEGVAFPARFAARLGQTLSHLHYKGKSFRIPDNFNELLAAFRQSETYLALLPKSAPAISGLNQTISSREARELLFDEKLSSFLTGRDARVMHYAPEQNGLESIMPFSSPALLLYFRGLEMGWRDVWSPKRFISQYLIELMGVYDFDRIYGRSSTTPPVAGKKSAAWQKELLRSTPFGREIQSVVLSMPETWKKYAALESMQYSVSLYWFYKIMKKLGRDLL